MQKNEKLSVQHVTPDCNPRSPITYNMSLPLGAFTRDEQRDLKLLPLVDFKTHGLFARLF
jgi:hypothetical protein